MTWTLGVATLGGVSGPVGAAPASFDVVVEIALTSGFTTPAADRVWTDVTDYVEAQRGVNITWGRGDQFSSPQPSRLTLTLNNQDGRFTPENAAGAYYPNIKKGRPIRVRVRPFGGSYVHRFLGYVDEWPVEWPDGMPSMSTVTVTAISRQARLGRGATLKSIVEEEILYDGPTLYFPLGEPKGATSAGNIAPGRSATLSVTQVGAGGTLEFGEGIGPGTDDLTAPIFTPVDTTNGLVLRSSLSAPLATEATRVLEMSVWFTAAASAAETFLLTLGTPGGGPGENSMAITLTSDGRAKMRWGTPGSAPEDLGALTNGRDGNLHHLYGRAELVGAQVWLFASLDNEAGSVTAYNWAPNGGPVSGGQSVFPFWDAITIGGSPLNDCHTGTIAHATIRSGTAATSDARRTEQYNAGANGFTVDASGARIARYARLAGIPAAEVSTETGLSTSIAHKDTTGELPIALMQDVADTEDGVVFDGKDGTLTFHSRSHRYGATSAFTLDVALGDIEEGLQPKLDDQHLTNDVTASRPNGITVRSTNDASIDEYGYYRESLEVLTTSDNEVQARADWEVNRFGTPRVAIPNVRTDLLTSGVAAELLAADIGTKLTLTNLHSQAPATTADYFVEGGTEQIGFNSYFIEFNVSPAAYASVWQLNSEAGASQLDSTTVLAY